MTHVTCRLTAKNRDQLRNPTLGRRVRAIFTFTFLAYHTQSMCQWATVLFSRPSNRQPLSYGDYLKAKRGIRTALYCVVSDSSAQWYTYMCAHLPSLVRPLVCTWINHWSPWRLAISRLSLVNWFPASSFMLHLLQKITFGDKFF